MKEKDIDDIKEEFDDSDVEKNKISDMVSDSSVVEKSSEMHDSQGLEK